LERWNEPNWSRYNLRAIKAPVRQIAENAGFDAGVIAYNVSKSENPNEGFNAATGEYVICLKQELSTH